MFKNHIRVNFGNSKKNLVFKRVLAFSFLFIFYVQYCSISSFYDVISFSFGGF